MPTSKRIEGLLAKVETTYNTDSVPVVGSNAVTVVDRLWPAITPGYAFENERDEAVTGTVFAATPGIPRGRMATLDFGVELRGSRSGGAYAAGNKSEVSDLLRACCWAEALDTTGGAEKLTYTLIGPPHESVTLYVYAGGYFYKVTGARGQVSWAVNPGVFGVLRFQMQGFLVAETQGTSLPGGLVYSSQVPLAGVGLALSVGGIWTPTGQVSAAYDSGINIERFDSPNGTDALYGFDHGDQIVPTFRISAFSETATYDPPADKLARTSRSLSLQYGTVQYKKAKLTSTLFVRNVRNTDDQKGFTGWNVEYRSDGSDVILFN